MKLTLLGFLPAAMGAATRCNANKCVDAIIGTQTIIPIETRLAACASFMSETVYVTV